MCGRPSPRCPLSRLTARLVNGLRLSDYSNWAPHAWKLELMHVAVGQPTQEAYRTPMNSVGVDFHKTRCVARIKTQEGRIVEEFAFQNNPRGHEELITHLKAYPEVQVAIESTSNLWIPIYNCLEDEQIHTILTNPKKTRLIAEAKIKTDRLDARILADLLRANLLSASYVPPPEIRMQRSIIRERARLTQLRTIIKNRIHTLLDKHSIKTPYTDISGKHSLEWLRNLELPAGDRILLNVNLEQLNTLNRSIDRLTETIAASAVDNPEVRLLMGFTGIDYYSAMLLINEIGPIARFASPKKLVSYAGLAPSTHQSGNHTTHGHITKEGNSHIRWILVEAAQHASRHDPRLSQFYMRIMKRRGHNRALVAVARKMLVTIYHVLNHHSQYRGLRPELFENKIRKLEQITNSSLQTA
jgi:transposase